MESFVVQQRWNGGKIRQQTLRLHVRPYDGSIALEHGKAEWQLFANARQEWVRRAQPVQCVAGVQPDRSRTSSYRQQSHEQREFEVNNDHRSIGEDGGDGPSR